jgi:hypothetical protein
MRSAVFLTVLLIVLAGCSGSSPPGGESETTETAVPATEPGTTVSTSPISTPTTTKETPTPEPVDNPWGKKPIVVGIRNDAHSENHTAQVIDAVEYWNTKGREYATWTPAFEVQPDADDPDIVVEFTSKIERCGLEHPGTTLGCAKVLSPDSYPSSPEIVEIVTGQASDELQLTLRHEFGHTLGLYHGNEPTDIMGEEAERFWEKDPDGPYKVHIEFKGGWKAKRLSKEQIQHALDYYESGADGWLEENVSFETTDNRYEADLTIVVRKASDPKSTVNYRTNTITLEGLPHTRHGWHVGYWLGFLFGETDVEELPPPFDEPRVDDRENWW